MSDTTSKFHSVAIFVTVNIYIKKKFRLKLVRVFNAISPYLASHQ
jgi:hypothetical protein